MYHKIADFNPATTIPGHYVSADRFESHVGFFARRGYHSRSLTGPIGAREVVFTFDDGYENFLTNALPILRRAKFTATVFLVADLLGKTNEWDTRDGDVEERLMTLNQVHEAITCGIEFGSHTATHADLTAISVDDATREIERSRLALQALLGTNIDSFCYPYGRKNPEIEALVKKAGYSIACSTEKGLNDAATNPFALRRINVRRETSLPLLIYKLLRGNWFGK